MFTLADAALTPTIFFMSNFLSQFGSKGPFEGRPKLKAWWDRIQERPSTKKVIGEQQAALQAMMKR
jgi:glutathione S-transferase